MTSNPQEPVPLGPPGPPGQPDPWGMKRVENLITTLTGVLSARVVVTPLGEVSEVHVLTRSGTQPKQIVRNIESALMAQLGFKIDHRKISVAQTADVADRSVAGRSDQRARQASRRGVQESRGAACRASAARDGAREARVRR